MKYERNAKKCFLLILGFGITFLLFLISFLPFFFKTLAFAQVNTINGNITNPEEGQRVTDRIEVGGTLSASLPINHHLWIVVRRGNLLWPKEPEVFVTGNSWESTVFEGGRGQFRLVLFLVNEEGQREIRDWLRVGTDTGHFPGLESISRSFALDAVNVRGQ